MSNAVGSWWILLKNIINSMQVLQMINDQWLEYEVKKWLKSTFTDKKMLIPYDFVNEEEIINSIYNSSMCLIVF